MTWPETDDIPPLMGEPEPVRHAVAAPLDEDSYADSRPASLRAQAISELLRHALNPPPGLHPIDAYQWAAAPSGLGYDCCEDARALCRTGLRYSRLLGECLGCGATNRTLMFWGWSGPVRGGDREQ
jgi:hypothetical protein